MAAPDGSPSTEQRHKMTLGVEGDAFGGASGKYLFGVTIGTPIRSSLLVQVVQESRNVVSADGQ